MNYRILANKVKTKSQLRRSALKWFIYVVCLLLFYSLMCSGVFDKWQPFLIIPLAVSVALHERELSSCVFAAFCGLFIDMACRFIFGFSAVWLMIVCLATSLLSRNLIRVNLFNFLWIVALAILLEFAMDYLFNTFIWNISNRNMIFELSTLPSAISTFIASPLVYLFIKWIYNKLTIINPFNNYSPELNEGDFDIKQKNEYR